jgi:protein tyrosine phosphatase
LESNGNGDTNDMGMEHYSHYTHLQEKSSELDLQTVADKEFTALENVSHQFSEAELSVALENLKLNRYQNILAPNSTRVILQGQTPNYINASQIT